MLADTEAAVPGALDTGPGTWWSGARSSTAAMGPTAGQADRAVSAGLCATGG